jgi:hypothetical protein
MSRDFQASQIKTSKSENTRKCYPDSISLPAEVMIARIDVKLRRIWVSSPGKVRSRPEPLQNALSRKQKDM